MTNLTSTLNLMLQGKKDYLDITADMLPAHTHIFSATTSSGRAHTHSYLGVTESIDKGSENQVGFMSPWTTCYI